MSNRQLKFRVWDDKMQKFSYFDIRGASGHLPSDIPDNQIQQYTGTDDYYGTHICEGDILQEYTHNGTQTGLGVCKQVLSGWAVFRIDGMCWHGGQAKIVGNIFEYPNLLK